jgi:putative DNA primase/helicase
MSGLLLSTPVLELPEPQFDDDPKPLPPERAEAPSLPPEMLPEGLRRWLVDAAERACLPLELLAVPAIVALSGLIGRSVCIKPREYSDWLVVPNLWGAIVAPPGAKKSDAIAEALSPLGALERKARSSHQMAQLETRAEQVLLQAQLNGLKNKAKSAKGGVAREELAALMSQLEALEAVPEKRYTTQDTTVEKLGELLRDNPRGILITRDELAAWIAAMELQENAMARGFFLTSWNGTGSYTFDRIGRGTIHIPAACVSIIGGIQPHPLGAVFERLRSDPTRADGMLQRFQLLVWPDGMPPWAPPQTWPDRAAQEQAFEIFARLDGLEFRDPATGELSPLQLRFTPRAGQAFTAWHDWHESRLREQTLSEVPHFASHIAKYGSLAPSLAVIFHLVDVASLSNKWVLANDAWRFVGNIPEVSLEATNLALDWAEFLEAHARKVYGPELNRAIMAAHHLAEQIREGLVADGQTVRDIQRSSRAWAEGWRLGEALHALEVAGWLKVVELSTGGRPSEVVRLHPNLRREL